MKRFAETMRVDRAATQLCGINQPFPIRHWPVKFISAVVLLNALTTGFAPAALITFDDLPTTPLGGSVVPNGYRELNWSNMYYLHYANNSFGSGSGYSHAVVSFPHVAFMGDDSIGQFALVSGPTFDFNSAWLTAAWRNGLNVRVRGYAGGVNGTLRYDTTVIVNTSGPTFFTFNYLGIDTLRFDPSGGVPGPVGSARHFVVDDMTIRRHGEPTAQNLSVVAAANFSNPISLPGSDPNGIPLSFSILVAPAHGTLSGTAPNVIYTPNKDFLGADSFIYVVSNGTFTSDPARVSITVKKGLLINNISLFEGNSGTTKATFTVTITTPGSDLDLVTVNYRTADGTAKAGSDYVATSGTLVFGENTAQTLTVSVVGDTFVEPNETFLVQLSNASANAVIVNGIGRCTIKNDDFFVLTRVGTAALTPENSVVDVGETVNLSLTWTHPVGWRQLNSVDLLIVDDEGESLAVRWQETGNSFSLFNPAADRFVRTAEAGSPTRFDTSAVTLHLEDSTGGGPPGQTATIDFSLSFKPQAAGRTFSVEAFATDDAGDLQGFESVGTLTVLPR